MEQYNWIKAYYASQNDDIEHEVFVKQEESCSEYFVSDKGNRFHISELDLTHSDCEPQLFNLEEFEKRNKEIERQYKENQAVYMEMLSRWMPMPLPTTRLRLTSVSIGASCVGILPWKLFASVATKVTMTQLLILRLSPT